MPVDSVSVITPRVSPFFPSSSPGADVPDQGNDSVSQYELSSSPEQTRPSPPASLFPLRKRYQEFYRQEISERRRYESKPEEEEEEEVSRSPPADRNSVDVKTEDMDYFEGRKGVPLPSFNQFKYDGYSMYREEEREKEDVRGKDLFDSLPRPESQRYDLDDRIRERNDYREGFMNERTYVNGNMHSGSAWMTSSQDFPHPQISPYDSSPRARRHEQYTTRDNMTPLDRDYEYHTRSPPHLSSRYQRELKFESNSLDEERSYNDNYRAGKYSPPMDKYIPQTGKYSPPMDKYNPQMDKLMERGRCSSYSDGSDRKIYDTTPLAAMIQRFSLPPPALEPVRGLGSEFPPRMHSFSGSSLTGGAQMPMGRLGLEPRWASPDSMMRGGAESGDLTKKDQYYCHICTFVGTSELEFTEHMKCHFEHQCPYCTYSSRTEGRLKRHISDFHADKLDADQQAQDQQQKKLATGKPKLLKCRQCNWATTIREDFWAHSRSHIKKEKQLSCPRCEFVTEFKHHLEYHIRNHVGSKPYKCTKCTYTCVNKSMLNSHMKSHTNIYRYRCASCSYATKYAHSLKIHLQKKNHTAAVVLNEDGSLPADGMGNFDLLSKRGPPKGLKLPKKTSLSLVEPNVNPLPDQGSLNKFPQFLSGFQDSNDATWLGKRDLPSSLLSYGKLFGMGNDSIKSSNNEDDDADYNIRQNLPFGVLSRLASANLSMFTSKFPLPEQNTSSSSVTSSSMISSPMKCKLCRHSCSSAAELARHFVQEHSNEGKKILESVGIQLDMLSTMSWPSPNMKEELKAFTEKCRLISPLLSKYFKLNEEEDEEETSTEVGSSYKEREVGLESPSQIPSPEEQLYQTSQPQLLKPLKESPLDLSSKLLEERFARKRMLDDDDESYDHVSSLSDASSPMSGSMTGTRKRSRKGKACRLDVMCLKMQQQETWEDDELARNDSSSRRNTPDSVSEQNLDESDEMKCLSTYGKEDIESASKNFEDIEDKKPAIRDENIDESDAVKKISEENNVEGSYADDEIKNNDDENNARKILNEDDMTESSVKVENAEESKMDCETTTDADDQLKMSESGFYMCNHCEMGFRDRITHSIHMGYHGFNDPFRCNMCGYSCADRVEFFIHMAHVAHA